MKVLSLSEVKTNLSQIVDKIHERNEGIMVTKNGKPSAVLLSLDEYESLKENLLIRSDTDLMVEIKEGIENLKKSKQLYTLQELFEVKKRFN